MEFDLDLILTIASGLAQVSLAVMGIYVSLKPPPKFRHRTWIALFIIIGLAGVFVTGLQQHRNLQEQQENKQTQNELKDKLTAIQNEQKQAETGITSLKGLLPKPAPPEPLPDVTLRLVYPESPGLLLVNNSKAVAKDIKWAAVIWNMDHPERINPLPIPTSAFDWLRPYQSGGPEGLFGTPMVSSLIKNGDRLIGTISVNCPHCARGRTYAVYIEWGKGGRMAEFINNKSGVPLIPVKYTPDNLKEIFKIIKDEVDSKSSMPIGEQ